MIRQQGTGGQKQMVRLRRFQAGARGQGQSGQGQGEPGEDGESGDGQQGHAGQRPGQAGQGEGQQGHAGQGQPGPGQGGHGQGGQGQQGASGGETWIVGPNGEKMLMISREARGGAGTGSAGRSNGGGGEPKGGPGWGTEHDEHVQGQARSIKSGTEDTQVAGQDSTQGTSRSEVIQGAAERGFTSRGYQKVYREYHTVAEEALEQGRDPRRLSFVRPQVLRAHQAARAEVSRALFRGTRPP